MTKSLITKKVQQFTIPQFIDVEDKIIGPVTTRQFIIILGGFLLMGVSYKMFDFSLFITVSILILIVSGAFAFLKINGRPFHFFVLNLAQTLRRPRLRIWNHKILSVEKSYEIDEKEMIKKVPPLIEKRQPTLSRLAELSLIVDTQGEYKGEGGKEAKIVAVQ